MKNKTKYNLFQIIHDYPLEIYLMWGILVITVLLLINRVYGRLTYYSETYQFIKNL
jgi:hypothetical protein